MFVAASSECFPELSFDAVLRRFVDLEYSNIELSIGERGHIKPSQLIEDLDSVVAACRETYRLTVSGYSVDLDPESPDYYDLFAACCRLAKATKVVSLTTSAAELGTPFNAEIDRLRRIVSIATHESVRVGLKTETGRITQDPDTAVVLCNNVKGLGLTLDPSHYVYGPLAGGNYDHVIEHVFNVHLRDTTKDKLQVRIGQGEIEYSRLVTLLERVKYNRALVVHVTEMEGVDHIAELRKMRLLLESML